MRIILNPSLDPAFNLACEEYLLNHTGCGVFMLWRNDRAVIIGKNQNPWSEVALDYTESHGIPVIRRLTGGGAVFHDPGNINYTFITKADGGGIDFARFSAPIISALAKFDITAELNGRNDIAANGAKISGGAQCRHRRDDGSDMLLHHGTLLFSADLTSLTAALRVNPAKLESKGVASVRARVTNIRDIPSYRGPGDATDFMNALAKEAVVDGDAMPLTDAEIGGISTLAEYKYRTWDWNFGKAPAFSRTCEKRFPFGTVTLMFDCKGGIITEVRICGDYFGVRDTAELEARLAGMKYTRKAFVEMLANDTSVGEYINGCSNTDFEKLLFNGD